jgi:inosine-uridine nucleoside N-ribohydrolase
MAQKVIFVADPGIDTAVALTLALFDPSLEVIGIAASAGNVAAAQATDNVQTLIHQIDPPRYPRTGAAPAVEYDADGTKLHGGNGLGNVKFPRTSLHQQTPSDRLICELARLYPKDVAVVCLGPATVLARALDRDPELCQQVARIILVGGCWREPGNSSPVAEFHFWLDPAAARQVLRCGAPTTLIPLDVTRKLVFSPSDLLELPAPDSRACQFLRQIVPAAIRASSNLYGIEGFHLKDVLGVAALVLPGAVPTQAMYVDVETRGELTRGMSVVDARPTPAERPNVDLAMGLDVAAARAYIDRTLRQSGKF